MSLDPGVVRDPFSWHGPRIGFDMRVARYGNWGHALRSFPALEHYIGNRLGW